LLDTTANLYVVPAGILKVNPVNIVPTPLLVTLAGVAVVICVHVVDDTLADEPDKDVEEYHRL
jgi:hypothetical protein